MTDLFLDKNFKVDNIELVKFVKFCYVLSSCYEELMKTNKI